MLEKFKLYLSDYTYELKKEPNLDTILNYFRNECFEVNNLKEFTNSLKMMLIISTVSIEENFNELKKFFNEKDLELISSYEHPKNKYKIINPIKEYLNKYLKEIFKTEDNVLIERTLNLICTHGSTKENFKYIVNDFMKTNQTLLLKNFNIFYDALSNIKELKPAFIENILIPINIPHLKYQLEILSKHQKMKDKFEEELLKSLQTENFNTMQILSKKKILNLILNNKIISNNLKLRLESLNNHIETDLDIYVEKYGHIMPIKINIENYIESIKNITIFRKKMFLIDYKIYNNTAYSTYTSIADIKDYGFLQLSNNLSNTTDHSSMFLISMDNIKQERYSIISYLIYEYKNLFWKELKNLYNDVLKILGVNETNQFVEELQKIFNLDLYKDSSIKIVGEIEYLLRSIYIKKEIGTSLSKLKYAQIKLVTILNSKKLDNLFTEGDLKCLKYILIEEAGFNYRNALAHNNLSEVKLDDTLYILSVFIFLLVSIYYFES